MPSDFLNYEELLGMSGDEVRRLQNEAFADSSQRMEYAGDMLGKAGMEARAQGLSDISQAQSYGAYIQATRDAEARRAKAAANYMANAGTPLERSMPISTNTEGIRNELQRREGLQKDRHQKFLTAAEQQKQRNAAYNEKYRQSMAAEEEAGRKRYLDAHSAIEAKYQRDLQAAKDRSATRSGLAQTEQFGYRPWAGTENSISEEDAALFEEEEKRKRHYGP
jgi:hypothetical protein